MKKELKIYLGSDHAGFEMKNKIKRLLEKKNIKYDDLGAYQYKENDDYPDFAYKVSKVVSKNGNTKGILICGSGAGMSITANKVKGIRAVEAYDEYSAKMSREHNDSNILTLGARTTSYEMIKKIIDIWLKTNFSKEKRHLRRIKKISDFENKR